jgi:hypothetical protein
LLLPGLQLYSYLASDERTQGFVATDMNAPGSIFQNMSGRFFMGIGGFPVIWP